MKINSMPAFRADFDTNKNSTVNFLQKAFCQAIENNRLEEFDNAIDGIKKMSPGRINIIKSSPKNDVFIVTDDLKRKSVEITVPKKDDQTNTLDTLIGLKILLRQIF